MPAIVLTVLKVAFLALLYLFVYRVAKAVVVDLRAPKAVPAPADGTGVSPVAAPVRARAPSRSKGKPPGQVVVLDAKGKKVRAIKLLGTVQIGRADACHIKLPDTYASQFHARIFPQDGSWFVEDLGSTTARSSTSARSPRRPRSGQGDRVRIGTTILELKA